jgi:hypothetical protein
VKGSHPMTPRCSHIFPASSEPAHPCGSPALRGEAFCYYHHPTRKPAANPRARRGFTLAAPTDQQTVQHALSEVIVRLAANKIDVHRAGLLLYSLQIASRLPQP